MKPLNMVLELYRKFVPMDENELAKLMDEATKWDAKQLPDSENKLESFYAVWTRKWGIRLLTGAVYLWLTRKIPQWINPEVYEDEDED